MGGSRIRVQGHRGARGVRPENTLAAFVYAMNAGADAVELDLTLTRDGALVVSHDPVAADSAALRLPSLDDVFRLVAPSAIELNLEVKIHPKTDPPAITRLVLESVDRHGMRDRVMVESFDFRVLHAMRALAPEIRRGALTEDDPRSFPEIAGDAADPTFIAPHFSLVTGEKVLAAHAAGLDVVAWTVNLPDDWTRVSEAQVDAIITDDPAALIRWLRGV
ncbi:MAG TPA: glycerophosphodiester phosphodiesterase family protein [Candidatus Sulfopaludibacter sp.]|jgi:glycerophosphoryl diester phosphodiesterase|nr:glycerophosphodiester phosphodiesterase family protein [Candidatus Sulfopaludibacter sp.]